MTIKKTIRYYVPFSRGAYVYYSRTLKPDYREIITIWYNDVFQDSIYDEEETSELFYVNEDTLGKKIRKVTGYFYGSACGTPYDIDEEMAKKLEPIYYHREEIGNLRSDKYSKIKQKFGGKVEFNWQPSKEAKG